MGTAQATGGLAAAQRLSRLGLLLLTVLTLSMAQQHVCSGYDEEWGGCSAPQACKKCTPVDCVFASWSDWYPGGGCSGLIFRQRVVEVTNNECGRPCAGPKIESAAHALDRCVLKPQDCAFAAWKDWSSCKSSTDQSYRKRATLTEPLNGGAACVGETLETKPCGSGPAPVPCMLSDWEAWTSCSSTCGKGRHTRMRRILQEAQHNGEACQGMTLQTEACMAAEPCPSRDCKISDWSKWSMCDVTHHSQRFRVRKVLETPLGSGLLCAEALKQTMGCPAPSQSECVISQWSSWTGCDQTCGGGQTERRRYLEEPMRSNGTCPPATLREMRECNPELCEPPPQDCTKSEWGDWSECSAKCGKGSMTRKRKVMRAAEKGGRGCTGPLEEITPCQAASCAVTDCSWSVWYDWTACTSSCGGGTKQRSRAVAAVPRHGGALCDPVIKSEALPCNTQTCLPACIDGMWGNWKDWTECSATCSSGFKSRRREVFQDPTDCGKPVRGSGQEFAACASLRPCIPSRDCALSEWQEWSYCSNTCSGVRERNRVIEVFASGNGLPCHGKSLKEIEACNSGGAALAKCTVVKQDCLLSEWSEWNSCSSSCGGGQREKVRRLLSEPRNSGLPCSDSLAVTSPCNTQPCGPVEPCRDCLWGQWGEWSACTKCGGQRWRHRSIERMPNSCGQLCSLQSAKEVSNCTSHCTETLYCAWTKWSEMSGCDAGCGTGTTMRNRALGLAKSAKEYLFSGTDDIKCSGTQLDMVHCPAKKPCREECAPRHGEFGAWSEWRSPSCLGLCERQRVIATMNNECGEPVDGPLLETKRCNVTCSPSLPCILSEWQEWTACADPNGQRYRTRKIEQMPTQDGMPCQGALNETRACAAPCLVEPCVVSAWADWSACALSCGGGWQMRSRRVLSPAKCGGPLCDEKLEELHMCNIEACPIVEDNCTLGEWSSWSGCGADGQRYRERAVEKLAERGAPCAGDLIETETCVEAAIDCQVSNWTEWDECEKTCGGGQRHRHRQVQKFPEHGGKACPADLMQTRGCNAEPCSVRDCELSDWGGWQSCSASCGVGQQSRLRSVIRMRNPGGVGCNAKLSETRSCRGSPECPKTDCAWGEWSEWSGCSRTCAGGQMARSRRIAVAPRGGGEACKPEDREEAMPCNTQPCTVKHCVDGKWGAWQGWSPCSASCGGGVTFRTRQVMTTATECGSPATGKDRETHFCNVDTPCAPSVDCEFTEWGSWADCSSTCDGVKRRSRRIGKYGRGAGKYCIGALKETFPCSPSPGESAPAGCALAPVVDCLLGTWAEWSQCTASCGGGQRLRRRDVSHPPQRGGAPCAGPLSEVEECHRDSCPSASVDCELGEWQDWSACDKCGGQRKRFRSIVRFPLRGGANCPRFSHEETGVCPSSCGDAETYCTWHTWKDWGACTAKCGAGKRRRRRDLVLSHTRSALPEPLANTELILKFEQLQQVRQRLQTYQLQELLAAFAGGCLSFVLALAGTRLFATARTRRSRRHSGVPEAGSAPSSYSGLRELDETELPLVAGRGGTPALRPGTGPEPS